MWAASVFQKPKGHHPCLLRLALSLKLALADYMAGEADQSPQHPKACDVAIMFGGRSGNVYMYGFRYCRSKMK